VRISKEIQEFASGKAEGFERMGGRDGATPGAPKKSAPLTPDQQEILAKRGVLSPEEIHRLAAKTKGHMATGPQGHKETGNLANEQTGKSEKLSCHSDYVDPETAKRMQEERGARVVQVDVRPALGIGKEDRVV
jgi:phosphomethylpyrimidine synthase